ncbi:ABC transporter ATP-binding protein [Burkholderia pyrrocinia]|uniref:ABC transporter ATP-binding protein n=1 Tax=Burkholderia pyrrocinia TaxID=60550 RepID=UPI002AB1AB70|nr:ABC transporter ATP-binding protein [Burkholderia pyrrocinia]
MIEFRNVSKSYQTHNARRVILNDVSFSVPPRKNLALLGRNGAGKSTLIRLIAGTEKPDSGRILRRGAISFPMALSSFFVSSLTARQNVNFISRVYGYAAEDVVKYVEDFAELGDYFDMPVRTLSSGMRARLSFGISLAFEFDTYLIDEVTAVGDAAFRSKAQRELNKRIDGSNVVLVSHNNDLLRETCQVALILEKGVATLYEDINEAIAVYTGIVAASNK